MRNSGARIAPAGTARPFRSTLCIGTPAHAGVRLADTLAHVRRKWECIGRATIDETAVRRTLTEFALNAGRRQLDAAGISGVANASPSSVSLKSLRGSGP